MTSESLVIVQIVVGVLLVVGAGAVGFLIRGMQQRIAGLEKEVAVLRERVASIQSVEEFVREELREIKNAIAMSQKLDQLMAVMTERAPTTRSSSVAS